MSSALPTNGIPRNPARLVKNQRTRDSADRRNEQKLPFSDEELKRMYEACDARYGKQEIKWSREIHHRRIEGHYARYNSKWTGQDLADFISVSLYTGLRISDVATFHVDRMEPFGQILLRTTKAGTQRRLPGCQAGFRNAFERAPRIWSVHLRRAYDEGHQRRNRRFGAAN